MEQYMTVNGRKSRGYVILKPYREKVIYSFLMFGRMYWCGDGENMRESKKDAFLDAGVPADYFYAKIAEGIKR